MTKRMGTKGQTEIYKQVHRK